MKNRMLIVFIGIFLSFSLIACNQKAEEPINESSITIDEQISSIEEPIDELENPEDIMSQFWEYMEESSVQSISEINPPLFDSGIKGEFFTEDATYRYESKFEFYDELADSVELSMKKMYEGEKGNVFHLTIKYDEDFTGRDCYGWDRCDLGYFYVMNDFIYVIYDIKTDAIPVEEQFLKDGKLVYISENLLNQYKDNMKDNDYIEWKDGDCIYHYYNDQVETCFYLRLMFSKDKVLKYYLAGFGASSEEIELKLPQ